MFAAVLWAWLVTFFPDLAPAGPAYMGLGGGSTGFGCSMDRLVRGEWVTPHELWHEHFFFPPRAGRRILALYRG